MSEKEGTARLLSIFRGQSEREFDVREKRNKLGVYNVSTIKLDGIDEDIPVSEFLFLKDRVVVDKRRGEIVLNAGDRIACIPIGDYYVVLGRVTENA